MIIRHIPHEVSFRHRIDRTQSLILLVACLLLISNFSHAQFATVKGVVQTQHRVIVHNASVNILDPKSHKLMYFEIVRDNGEYFTDEIQPGTYDFVACGLPYIPGPLKTNTVREGDVKSINLVLENQGVLTKMNLRLKLPLGPDTDGSLYIRDRATSCIVQQSKNLANGEYEFRFVEPPYDVCTHKSSLEISPEEYTCALLVR